MFQYASGFESDRRFGQEKWFPSADEALNAALEDSGDRIDGLFMPTGFDLYAICFRLKDRGLVPGEDIVLAGCDIEQVIASRMAPPPITIDVSPTEVGREAVRQVQRRLEEGAQPASSPRCCWRLWHR